MELILIALIGVMALAPLLYAATVFIAYRSASYQRLLWGGAGIATLGVIAVPVGAALSSLYLGVGWFLGIVWSLWGILGGWWFVAGLAMVTWGAALRLASMSR